MTETTRYTYGKKDKLKSRKQIALLFKDGKSFTVFPLKCIWLYEPASEVPLTIKCGVTAQKRNFAKAVDRNKIKRHLREAWRLQKPTLEARSEELTGALSLFFLYVGKDEEALKSISGAMQKSISKLEASLWKK